jgi:hypothetical protein
MTKLRLHQAAISALKIREPRIKTRGFRGNLLSLLEAIVKRRNDESDDLDDSDDFTLEDYYLSHFCIRMLRYDFKFIPDAHVIDEKKGEVLIFEVEDTHVMKGKKAWYLVNLAHSIWWELDVNVRIFIVDRYADVKELDVNLLQAGMLQEFGSLFPMPNDNAKSWYPTMYEGMQQVSRPLCKCHSCGDIIPIEHYKGHVKTCGEKPAF